MREQKVLLKKVGVDDIEGPPVTIPNTEVKLNGAENTWLVTARENREMPTLFFYVYIFTNLQNVKAAQWKKLARLY